MQVIVIIYDYLNKRWNVAYKNSYFWHGWFENKIGDIELKNLKIKKIWKIKKDKENLFIEIQNENNVC
jgi:hypothetical protein